jgi:hypothetical protein
VQRLRMVAIALILLVLVYVVLSPGVVYAPVPKVILFLLSSVFVAVLVGAEATTKFRLQLPGFLFVTGGTGALILGILYGLVQVTKPDKQVVVFEVVDGSGEKVNLGIYGAFELERHPSGLQPTVFVNGNAVVLIFPEQVVEQAVVVRTSSGGHAYRGIVSYAKPPAGPLRLSKELK